MDADSGGASRRTFRYNPAVSAAESPRFEVDATALEAARNTLEELQVCIFIVAYEAQQFIEGVLRRIPEELRGAFAEIVLIDDSSSDATFDAASAAGAALGLN